MLEWFASHPLVLVAPLFGAAIASFLGVVIDRVPRGESLGGRSQCACGRPLGVVNGWRPENVPVAGWLAVGGRTRCCDQRLPVHFLVAEVGLAVAFGLAAAITPPAPWPVAVLVAVLPAVGYVVWGLRRAD